MTIIKMDYFDWAEKFQPIEKPGTDDIRFDTHFDDEFLATIPDSRIWTLVECDDEIYLITNGRRFVNRAYYYVTEVPHDENDTYEVD